jgi:UrcA family protein
MLFRSLAVPAFLAFTIGTAHAAESDLVSTSVPYGDLDLTQPADDQILAQRLQDAAKSVCLAANPDAGPGAVQGCISTAIDLAMTQIQDRLDQQVDDRLDVIRTAFVSP